jgi:MFS transporter, DHA1 family, inner membrane transport protein
MRFFDNSAINRTYLHSALQILAESTGGVFVFVFLLKAGFSVAVVFCALAGWSIGRLVLRQLVLPATLRFGLRNCLIFGVGVDAVSYMILGQIHEPGPLLIAYLLTFSLGSCFYWTCYHSLVATLGNAEKRGSQVSAVATIAALNGIIGPLIGGLVLVHAGGFYGFLVAAIVQASSILPLINLPNVQVAPVAKVDTATLKNVRQIFFADGMINASAYFIWVIALFRTLGEKFDSFGVALAIAGVVAAIISLGAGRLIDLGHQKQAQLIAYSIMALSIVLKSVAFATPWSAVVANALGAIAGPLYWSAMMSRVFNLSQASACPLRFQIAGEAAFDLGSALGCIVAAAFMYFGYGFFFPLIFGVVACAFGYFAIAKPAAS